MKTLLERYLAPPRDADGGGAGGVAAGQENAGAGATGGAAAANAGGSGAAAAAASADLYRPQGLPETMFGATNNETIDKMQTALQGYRDRESRRGVPDKVEAYSTIDADKLIADLQLDTAVKPHLAGLDQDPVMAAVGKLALARGIPAGDVQAIVGIAYAEAQKAGYLDAFVDPVKEREALIPEAAKSLPKAEQDKAIDARLQENEDFIKLLAQPGPDGKAKLDKGVAEHALLMLMDSAQGNQFIEFMRANLTGVDRAQPLAGQGGQAGSQAKRDELRARMAAPEMNPQHPKFSREAYDALDVEYQKLIGV